MRRDFPESVKKAARARAKGLCEGCGVATGPHNPPEVDHDKEDWEGGEPVLENAIVRGKKCCHEAKSAAATTRRAKADRQGKFHLGIKRRKGPPMPGTKASGIKKRLDGTVVWRSRPFNNSRGRNNDHQGRTDIADDPAGSGAQ